MASVLHFPSSRIRRNEERSYATDDDFQRLFSSEITDFFRLSLQLTADAEKAERCFIDAMRDCFGSSTVSRGFARIWAHRMVIQNGIRLTLGIENRSICDGGCEFHLQPSEYPLKELQESVATLELPDFDRLVFVICILERLSILDCALLLRRSPKEVNDAIARATKQVASAGNWTHTERFTMPRTGTDDRDPVQ